jgi:hypothetical protein
MHQLDFPDFHELTEAFRLIAMEWPDPEHEAVGAPKKLTNGATTKSSITTPTQGTCQATHQEQPGTQTPPAESTVPAEQELHVKHQPQASSPEPNASDTDDLISKEQHDLNTLLHRKSYIQTRIAARNSQAAYEDYKARRYLAWTLRFIADAQACLGEAVRLRAFVDEDQEEVEAIDEHLTGAMGVERRESHPWKA